MKVTPLAGNIGAEVRGVHLGSLDDATFEEIARALWAHQVLVQLQLRQLNPFYWWR